MTGDASNDVKIVGMYKNNTQAPQGLLFIINEKNGKSHFICLPNNQANDRVKELYAADQKNLTRSDIRKKYQDAITESGRWHGPRSSH